MKRHNRFVRFSIPMIVALTAYSGTLEAAPARMQSGKASWYGPELQGRRTASGERFDMNAYSAAHRTHAFGTKLCVRNLRNGREVTVRVNDRGPFVRGRIVDVSRMAAKSLGMIRSGTASVQISVTNPGQKVGSSC